MKDIVVTTIKVCRNEFLIISSVTLVRI